MTWEWRRVRRSCGSSAREKLIGELQYWNTALAKVFEKPEIPHGGDSDGILVQRLQVQFSSKTCNDVRSTLHQTYDAFTQTWQCDCPEHSGSLLLTWHKEESHVPTKAKLELPLLNGSWACLTIQPPKEQNNIPDTFLQRDGVVESAQTNQDSTKKTGGIPWKIKQKLKSIKLLGMPSKFKTNHLRYHIKQADERRRIRNNPHTKHSHSTSPSSNCLLKRRPTTNLVHVRVSQAKYPTTKGGSDTISRPVQRAKNPTDAHLHGGLPAPSP